MEVLGTQKKTGFRRSQLAGDQFRQQAGSPIERRKFNPRTVYLVRLNRVILCDTQVPACRIGGIRMAVIDPQTERPMLDIALAKEAGNMVNFDLTPVRFEFLCRVAEGALPSSFCNECLEDMLSFKATRLLRKAESIKESKGQFFNICVRYFAARNYVDLVGRYQHNRQQPGAWGRRMTNATHRTK